MAVAPTAQQLSDFGIDTYERCLLWGAIQLASMLRDPALQLLATQNQLRGAISFGVEQGVASLGAELPYSLQAASATAFDLIASAVEAVDDDGSYLDSQSPSPLTLGPSVPIDPLPLTVDTLERLIVWCATRLACVTDSVTVRPFDRSRDGVNPSIEIRARIPIDAPLWFCSNNLIRTIQPVITEDPKVVVFASGVEAFGLGSCDLDAA